MPLSWVKVVGPANRDVYVNGNFVDPGGRTNEAFAVEIGKNTFFLLKNTDTIEAEKEAYIKFASNDAPQIVDLWPPGQGPTVGTVT
jgi:hypothetical protein